MIEDETVAGLGRALAQGEATSRELVQTALSRISALDPGFRSVRCLAVDALAQADASDELRRSGVSRGPLEGLPVLIKDNIDVAGLPTTAGALALEQSYPAGDASIVRRLRHAGAVVLGKTNLTELANFMTEDMPSGYSSLGGQVLNPYDTSLTPSGSSSGSAVAVALQLCVVAVGTETDGSITSPAVHQSLVGLKPTLGLVSRSGVLPIASSQDTPGPMARTVADAAALLQVLAGVDPADPATARAGLDPVVLDAAALDGARLGVVAGPDPSVRHLEAQDALRSAGAVLVDVELPVMDHALEMAVLVHEFGRDLDGYLSRLPATAPIRSLRALRDWNDQHPQQALKFGQTHLEEALAVDHDSSRASYEAARHIDLAYTAGVLERALTGDLEALVFPGADGCSWAARAGWPSIVVPAGFGPSDRRPVGLMLVSRPWTDARLLSLAYAYEQASRLRRSPQEVNPSAFPSRVARPGAGS